MKERFIKRYKDAVMKYFNTGAGDPDSSMIRNYIVNEYEQILEEEFGMKHEEVHAIYNELYIERYAKEERQ